jgi:hypothetical protein
MRFVNTPASPRRMFRWNSISSILVGSAGVRRLLKPVLSLNPGALYHAGGRPKSRLQADDSRRCVPEHPKTFFT